MAKKEIFTGARRRAPQKKSGHNELTPESWCPILWGQFNKAAPSFSPAWYDSRNRPIKHGTQAYEQAFLLFAWLPFALASASVMY
jgi:hypothetical protein